MNTTKPEKLSGALPWGLETRDDSLLWEQNTQRSWEWPSNLPATWLHPGEERATFKVSLCGYLRLCKSRSGQRELSYDSYLLLSVRFWPSERLLTVKPEGGLKLSSLSSPQVLYLSHLHSGMQIVALPNHMRGGGASAGFGLSLEAPSESWSVAITLFF